jgi:hypothetical protein
MRSRSPLGLAGAHRRHLPRGRRAGRQTWRRRTHGAVAWTLACAFGILAATALAVDSADAPTMVAVAAAMVPLPYLSRPLRGGPLARAPRRARLRIAVAPDAPRRGDPITISAPGAVEVGLVATCWSDRSIYQSTVADPVRLHEEWAPGEAASLRVPSELPFSYEGRHLSTAWAAVARAPSGRVAIHPVWVRA